MRRPRHGEVVLIRARVVHDYPDQDLITVRIATGAGPGGRGSWQQQVIRMCAVASIEPVPPEDEAMVPRHIAVTAR